ncbi:MAG: polysaccharide biosynthesis C-terminal domain-containing protein, partial [Bacteroidales bacterium]
MTKYAIYITLSGLVVTIVINLIFMPLYSYHAAAWAHLASYLVMFLFSLFLGRKYFPISYEWDKILIFIVLGLSIYGISLLLPDMGLWLKMAVHSLLIMVYLGTVLAMFKAEKKREALCGSEKEKDI